MQLDYSTEKHSKTSIFFSIDDNPVSEILHERKTAIISSRNIVDTYPSIFKGKKLIVINDTEPHKNLATIEKIIAELEENPPEGKTMIVLDVPIPVERGFLDTAEVIWVVAANSDIRAERLMKRMGISYDAAMDIIDSQLSNSEYEALADFVIINEKGRRELRKQIGEALERI